MNDRLFQRLVSLVVSVGMRAIALLAAASPGWAMPADTHSDTVSAPGMLQPPEGDDPLQIFRAPLLREGSSLVEALATLHRDESSGWWKLAIEAPDIDPSSSLAPEVDRPPPFDLLILPCTRLTEMERILESTTATSDAHPNSMRFKVSGRVFVFQNRNYFLPTHAAVVGGEKPMPRPPTGLPDPTTPADASNTRNRDDSAEAIARSLEQQTGPIARSAGSARRAATSRSGSTPGSEAAASTSGSASTSAVKLQENTAIVNRRGKITRDRSGGWLLVLDADAIGLSDPPLKLMPCSLLEGIEQYARRAGNNSPIIITGQVYLYNNQNYLLPTVYRIPRETSRITP